VPEPIHAHGYEGGRFIGRFGFGFYACRRIGSPCDRVPLPSRKQGSRPSEVAASGGGLDDGFVGRVIGGEGISKWSSRVDHLPVRLLD